MRYSKLDISGLEISPIWPFSVTLLSSRSPFPVKRCQKPDSKALLQLVPSASIIPTCGTVDCTDITYHSPETPLSRFSVIWAAKEVECYYLSILLEEFPSKTSIQFPDHLEPCNLKKDNTSELVHEFGREPRPHGRTVVCHSCLHIPCSGLDYLYMKIEQVHERYLSNSNITIILSSGHSSLSWCMAMGYRF